MSMDALQPSQAEVISTPPSEAEAPVATVQITNNPEEGLVALTTETPKTDIQLEANAFQKKLNEEAENAEKAYQTPEGKIRLDSTKDYFARQIEDLRRPGFATDMNRFKEKQADLSILIAKFMAEGKLRREDGMALQDQLYSNE